MRDIPTEISRAIVTSAMQSLRAKMQEYADYAQSDLGKQYGVQPPMDHFFSLTANGGFLGDCVRVGASKAKEIIESAHSPSPEEK